jgi:uncharacterized protein (DUF433 family)
MEVSPGISMDSRVRFGKPWLAGTRIDIATVLGGLAGGASVGNVALEYQLSREQIFAALRYAAHLAAHLPPAIGSVDESPAR